MLSQNKCGNLNAEQSAYISGRLHELLPHRSSFKLTQSFTQHFEILCCLQRGELQQDLGQKKREEQ